MPSPQHLDILYLCIIINLCHNVLIIKHPGRISWLLCDHYYITTFFIHILECIVHIQTRSILGKINWVIDKTKGHSFYKKRGLCTSGQIPGEVDRFVYKLWRCRSNPGAVTFQPMKFSKMRNRLWLWHRDQVHDLWIVYNAILTDNLAHLAIRDLINPCKCIPHRDI